MNVRRLWKFVVVGTAVVALGTLLAAPAWAAVSRQGDGPSSDTFGAMHASCLAGDIDGMQSAMGPLTAEDWQAMQEHMANGHHEVMGRSMMSRGGMMGAGMGMMGGMMGGRSGQGMMDW